MLSAAQQAALATRQRANRRLGQFSGPEFFVNQALTASSTPVLNRPVPVGEAVTALHLVVRGRFVIGTADYTTAGQEALQNMITRILITGASSKFGQQTLWDISGASLFAFPSLFQIKGNAMYVGSSAAAYTRQVPLSVPMASPVSFAQATNDIEMHLWVPFFPITPHSLNELNYALRPEDWPNGISVQIFAGDFLNCFGTKAGGSTVTATAWGSASGSPSVSVYTETALLGELRRNTPSAICCRQEQASINSFAAAGNNLVVINPVRQRITNLILKSGVLNTAAGAGANNFLTLTDLQIGNILLNFNGNMVRNLQDWFAAKEYYADMFCANPVGGYLPISFIESGNPNAALDATTIASGGNFILQASALATLSNCQLNCIQEWVIGDPQSRLPGQS